MFVCFNSNTCTGKVAVIEQMYPETKEYHCHCPNTMLKCTFPENATIAGFYVLVNGIQLNCVGYPNHEVQSSNGVLVLTVNATDSSVSGNSYICTAVYADRSNARSGIWTLPEYEG